MGVFRLSSVEKGKGRRNAPPFSPPPPASTRPPREPHPNEWYPQSHEQYPPRVISLDGPDPEINEEDHDAPVLHPPASPASVMDNIVSNGWLSAQRYSPTDACTNSTNINLRMPWIISRREGGNQKVVFHNTYHNHKKLWTGEHRRHQVHMKPVSQWISFP